MATITVHDPNTGADVTLESGNRGNGIWVTVENSDSRTFLTVAELLFMARNNASWRVGNP